LAQRDRLPLPGLARGRGAAMAPVPGTTAPVPAAAAPVPAAALAPPVRSLGLARLLHALPPLAPSPRGAPARRDPASAALARRARLTRPWRVAVARPARPPPRGAARSPPPSPDAPSPSRSPALVACPRLPGAACSRGLSAAARCGSLPGPAPARPRRGLGGARGAPGELAAPATRDRGARPDVPGSPAPARRVVLPLRSAAPARRGFDSRDRGAPA
jgi:hypothetical protein